MESGQVTDTTRQRLKEILEDKNKREIFAEVISQEEEDEGVVEEVMEDEGKVRGEEGWGCAGPSTVFLNAPGGGAGALSGCRPRRRRAGPVWIRCAAPEHCLSRRP